MGKLVQLYFSSNNRGPGKVINNLSLGLKKIGVDVTLNQSPVLDSKKISLSHHPIMRTHLDDLYIGPNVCVLPIDDPLVMTQKYKKYLVNSDWTYKAYKKWLPEEKLTIWPVGIDTDLFYEKKGILKTNDCLIYFKRRNINELEKVKKFLEIKNQKYVVVEYGSYSETDFIDIISKSKYSIVIDNCESQGIAIQEMMSSNLPLLVWDIANWNDRGDEFILESTSVPYWDDRCGLKFYNESELDIQYKNFTEKLIKFCPRNYILENLTLEITAKKLYYEI